MISLKKHPRTFDECEPCSGCGGRGKVNWESPPHRGKPDYAYSCGHCEGTGREPLPVFGIATRRPIPRWAL